MYSQVGKLTFSLIVLKVVIRVNSRLWTIQDGIMAKMKWNQSLRARNIIGITMTCGIDL